MATGAPEPSAIRETIGERTLRHHLGDLAAHFGCREVTEIVVNRPSEFDAPDRHAGVRYGNDTVDLLGVTPATSARPTSSC